MVDSSINHHTTQQQIKPRHNTPRHNTPRHNTPRHTKSGYATHRQNILYTTTPRHTTWTTKAPTSMKSVVQSVWLLTTAGGNLMDFFITGSGIIPDQVWRVVVWRLVVWCGMLWCGVACCGVVWCGVACCGVVWCGVVWHAVVWCGVVWHAVVWWGVGGVACCGVAWCDMRRCVGCEGHLSNFFNSNPHYTTPASLANQNSPLTTNPSLQPSLPQHSLFKHSLSQHSLLQH